MPTWSSSFPVSLDTFTSTPQVDSVDTVWANHPNTLAAAIEAVQAKLAITGGVTTGYGGLSFQAAGKASFPGTPGNPTLWADNSGGPGFILTYTDELGTDWPINATYNIGVGYNVADPSIVAGDLVSVDPAGSDDDMVRADARTGSVYPMHGIVVGIYGGGTLCDVMYTGEVQNAAWTGIFIQGTSIYLGAPGVNNGLAAAPPGGSGSIQQEVGFFRNTDTFVIRPSLVTTV